MEKFKSFMEKIKKHIWIFLIVWLVLVILFVAPLCYTITEGNQEGLRWIEAVSLHLGENFLKFPITVIFKSEYVNDFIKGIEYFSIVYIGLIIFSTYKTLPKSAFQDIEHGSSDWCRPGEQYKVLNKKEGLILAKDNYLPVDKPGNVNVLIVGRIWCW